ncbi:MAG: SsrA-binding protein SmpB [Patescibacteria group bacterium]
MALIENRKARFDFEMLERFEAGLELTGAEVKSLRKGQATLDGAYVIVRGNEAYLVGMHIAPYQPKNTPEDYDPLRPRRLLLARKEIDTLAGEEHQKGLTIVPQSVYNKGRYIKVSIAVARGKKKADKRETLKRREADRDIQKTLRRES